jgi:hypothetical protein
VCPRAGLVVLEEEILMESNNDMYRAYTKEWCGFKNCDWRLIFGNVGKLVVTPTEYQL